MQRDGHCRAYPRDSDAFYALERRHYAPLLAAWKAGAAFYDGTSTYGEPLTLKLGQIEAVGDYSPEVCADALEDEEQDRRERAIRGEE